MSSENEVENKQNATPWLWLSAVTVTLDQVTKWWIVQSVEVADRFSLLPILDITHRHNPGAAFSFLAGQGGWQRWFFVVLASGVSLFILLWLRRLPRRGHIVLAIGLALILGGALGNVIDRVHYGYVIDFLLLGYGKVQFPFAFNVADSAISLGAALLIFDSLFGQNEKAPS